VDVAPVARATDGCSGADLRLLCEEATELAFEESVQQATVRPITAAHLHRALRGLRPSTPAWFELAQSVATFANQAGEYDDLLQYLSRARRRRG
jgi:SpoVK/Ycf46/Vps4 family AAA+-type ATPase